MVPTLWASYAIFGCRGLIRYCHLALCGHKGLSDGVHLKNDIDKSVTVYDNGKSVTRDRLGVVGLNPTKFD